MLGGTAHPKTGGLEVLERAGDVGDLRDGQVHDRTRGRLVRGNRDLGGALVGNDDARRAHDFRRAHDGAEVAGVRHVVEHDHQGGAVGGTGGGDDVRQVRIGEFADLQNDALMGTVAGNGIELSASDALDAHARLAQTGEQVAHGGVVLNALCDEGALDGKAGAQRLERGTAPLDIVALDGMDITARRGRRLGIAGVSGMAAGTTPVLSLTLIALSPRGCSALTSPALLTGMGWSPRGRRPARLHAARGSGARCPGALRRQKSRCAASYVFFSATTAPFPVFRSTPLSH